MSSISIRFYEEKDSLDMYYCIKDSISEMIDFLPWVHENYSLEDAENWVKNCQLQTELKLQYDFVIEEKTNKGDIFLGGIGLLNPDYLNKTAYLGYWVSSISSRKGVATEAARLALDFAKHNLGFKKIYIESDIKNKASLRVIEKLGAKFLNTKLNADKINGKEVTKNIYELNLDETDL